MREAKHGTQDAYSNHACRCPECRSAHNAYMRQYNARRRREYVYNPDDKHGSSHLYSQLGCRCRVCIDAGTARGRLRKTFKYEELVERFGSTCNICGKVPRDDKRLCMDHDHKSGEIRGLLCHGCNTGLGKFGDSIDGLQKAIDYLRRC